MGQTNQMTSCTKKPPAPSASRTKRTINHGQKAPLECDTVTSTQWITDTSTTTVLVPTTYLVPTTILVPTVSIVPTTVTDRATVTQTRNQSVTVWVPTTYTATITRTLQYPVTVTSAHDVTVTTTATETETIVTTLTTSYPVISHETVTRPASTVTRPASTITQPASTITQPASTVTQPASTSKITVCPAPTGLHAPLAPSSNLTFGCSPGSVCAPPMPRGCNMWPGPPSDDFACRASECIPSPPFTQTHWPDNETSYYYPPSNGYFNLDPTEFGLTYDVFADHGRDRAGQKRGQGGGTLMKRAPAPPARCFDECNNAYLIAEAGGKTDELCQARSSFRLGFELCKACIKTSSASVSVDDYIGSVFAQFLNFCKGRRSEPTSVSARPSSSSSSPSGPDQALSSPPLVLHTTTQVGASPGGFEPSSPSTTAQATTRSATTERPKTSSSFDSSAEDDDTTTAAAAAAANTGAVSAAKTSQSSRPEAGAASSTAHPGVAGQDESMHHAATSTPVVVSDSTSRNPAFTTSNATLAPKGTPPVLVSGVAGRRGLAGATPALIVAMIVLIV
ncbi:hypothetical protein MY11210_003636 [Beauveria gryllotalpidicola]